MTLPVSGAISLNQVNVELGLAGTTSINMNQASVRTLFGVPSGAISMSNGYGKANQFAFTISSNQTNANLRTLAVAAGWPGTSKVVATIGSGVQITSTAVGTSALTVNGSFPGGVELINTGTILGKGGRGGDGGWGPNYTLTNPGGQAGNAGGTALTVSVAITINNASGIVSGGGGGGGGGGLEAVCCAGQGGGGGGGGGNGTGAGGLGGRSDAYGAGGSAGGTLSGGAGGAGGFHAGQARGGTGGAGGTNAAAGATGGAGNQGGGGGGGGGAAVSGNSNVTWSATGTRYGSLV